MQSNGKGLLHWSKLNWKEIRDFMFASVYHNQLSWTKLSFHYQISDNMKQNLKENNVKAYSKILEHDF